VRGTALVLLTACGAGPPASTDARAYASVLADPSVADPTACGVLSDPDLAGDCGVVVAERRMAGGVAPSTVCRPVGEGVWGDECRFRAAEESMAAGDPDAAAALCLQVRTFRDACAQHLWDPALAGTWQDGDPGAALERARMLHAEWSARLGGETDLDDRLWRHWFRTGFQRGVPLPSDAAAFCSEAPADLHRPCLKATRRALAEAGVVR